MLNIGSKKNEPLNLNDLPRLIASDTPAEAAAEMAALRQPDKSWMGQEPLACSYDSFRLKSDQNRYVITHQEVPFECLYLPENSQKLYIMLSGGGAGTRKYPRFLRWKYQKFLKGNILCIDDPMYHFHPEVVRVMWYYGTKETAYLHLLLDIVKKAMQQLHIKAEDVTFIGSSGGGYAALYCANLLDHSTAIAMNPQLVLKNWDPAALKPQFQKWNIDLEGDDPHGRNRIMLTNEHSRFMLIINAASSWDINQQFEPFAEAHGITPTFGISQKNQIVTWLHHTKYTDLHSVFLEKVGLTLASYLCEKMAQGVDLNTFKNFSTFMNEVLYEKYELRSSLETSNKEKNTLYKYFVKNISHTIEETLYRRIPMQASPALRRYLDYNFEVETKVWKPGNIGYYIGEQMGFRFNIFYHNGKVYYRMKFDEYSKHFSGKEEMEAILNAGMGEKLTRWYYENDTLVLSLALDPDIAETQIAELTDLSIAVINEYLN